MLNGASTIGKTTAQVSKLGIARTFQNIRLFSKMSVLDNVKVGIHSNIETNLLQSIVHNRQYRRIEAETTEKAMDLLKFFNMDSLAYSQAGSLPYGAQRRLEIVRALATEPGIILLDEPAAGMNPSETAELMENIRKIRDEFKLAVLLIEHDMNLVMNICEGIAVLNYGKIIAKGTPSQIQGNQAVIEAYLGRRNEK
jgi:branched-chain amino acid transport system ATP-binding protein